MIYKRLNVVTKDGPELKQVLSSPGYSSRKYRAIRYAAL